MAGKRVIKFAVSIVLGMAGLYTASVFGEAASGSATDIAGIANTVTGTFTSIGKLMAATAYLAGFGLTIAAIFKFKQHKDNPQQIPMGTPITMLLVGVALIFLPNIIAPAGASIFGSSAKQGGFAGEGLSTSTSK